jgi:hypothetical protein
VAVDGNFRAMCRAGNEDATKNLCDFQRINDTLNYDSDQHSQKSNLMSTCGVCIDDAFLFVVNSLFEVDPHLNTVQYSTVQYSTRMILYGAVLLLQ